MNKEWAGVEKLVPVKLFPFIGPGPGSITFSRKRKRWGGQAQHIQNQRFAVAGPTISDKASFRLPTVRNRQPAVLCPLPIRPFVKRPGESAYLALIFCITIKIAGGGECAGEKVCCVDSRNFAFPRTAARLHVE